MNSDNLLSTSDAPPISGRTIWLFILLLVIIFIPGLLVDVMDVDAAQYASMSREMLETGNWLQVHNRYHDYLDKPPLLFWLSAFSMNLFGISNLAYKLPSFLFGLLSVYSTFRLAELLYNRFTGLLSAFMLVSSLGYFIMVNDVRTDTLLMGSVAFALWQITLYLKTKSWRNLVLGFMGIGMAMLAKGPLGIVMPALALSCDFLYRRQWRNFVRWEWIVGLAVVAVMLYPMCKGLYEQFDLHPEKEINGKTNVSGLEFYFWTQSFGRITGDSDWGTKFDNGAGPFFFTHTFMWAFFPWSILTVLGLIKTILLLIKSRLKAGILPEMLTTGGFILIFLALSSSRYKLPHYIYVTLPLASVMAARYMITDVLRKPWLGRIFLVLHNFFGILLILVCAIIMTLVFPGADMLTWMIVAVLTVGAVLFFWKRSSPAERLILPLGAGLMAFYFTGFNHFYPSLLSYQSASVAGQIAHANGADPKAVFMHNNVFEHSIDFYSHGAPDYINLDSLSITQQLKERREIWIYTDPAGMEEANVSTYKPAEVIELPHYGIQFLTFTFLDNSKRESVLRKRYLLRYSRTGV